MYQIKVNGILIPTIYWSLEKISYEYLAEHLSEIILQYDKTSRKTSYAKTSHYPVWNALCRFKEFLGELSVKSAN